MLLHDKTLTTVEKKVMIHDQKQNNGDEINKARQRWKQNAIICRDFGMECGVCPFLGWLRHDQQSMSTVEIFPSRNKAVIIPSYLTIKKKTRNTFGINQKFLAVKPHGQFHKDLSDLRGRNLVAGGLVLHGDEETSQHRGKET
ncbi:hypothetical protein ABFV05_018699 [Capra hircus]